MLRGLLWLAGTLILAFLCFLFLSSVCANSKTFPSIYVYFCGS